MKKNDKETKKKKTAGADKGAGKKTASKTGRKTAAKTVKKTFGKPAKKSRIIDRMIDGGLVLEGTHIIIGLSGGPDSLCLLHALTRLSDSYDLTLVPVHVNHKLRPEADEEEDNVVRICERLGLECECYEADCSGVADEMGISTEEAGRQIRYEIFDEVAGQIEAEGVPRSNIMIAVAHNADDQAETVLFRLLRGTGVHGLSGMPAVRNSESGYTIIRPLIDTERTEIEEYIRENKLHPNIDASNKTNDYTRNSIRNELIPYLEEKYNPSVKQALRRYAELAEMDDSLLNEIAISAMDGHIAFEHDPERILLDITDMRINPISINTRIAGFILQTMRLEKYASFELITRLTNLMYSDNPSGSIDLPLGARAYREYDTIIFTDADEERQIAPDESLRMMPQIIKIRDFHPDDEYMYAAFDFDKFNEEHPGQAGELKLRTRQEGDYLPMKRGNKKIQDLLVDSKVMKRARDSILMVAIGSEVLWILPSKYFAGRNEQEKGRFSPKYHITEDTERVLFIEIIDNL